VIFIFERKERFGLLLLLLLCVHTFGDVFKSERRSLVAELAEPEFAFKVALQPPPRLSLHAVTSSEDRTSSLVGF